jgi:hypothetical protein
LNRATIQATDETDPQHDTRKPRLHHSGCDDGLLFGDADRFLTDLSMNLEVQAALLELGDAFKTANPCRHYNSYWRYSGRINRA